MGRKPGPEDRPGFFKVMLGDFSKRLQIPPAFAKFFNGTPLPQKIKLQNSANRFWQVNLEKIDDKLFFKKGWRAFVEDNPLELGDFVVFDYVGRSTFRFTILGKNACEKDVIAVPRKSNRVNPRGEGKASMFDNEQRHGKVSFKNGANQSDSRIHDKPVVINIEETDEEDANSVEFLEEIPKLGEKRKRTESKPSAPSTHPQGKEAGGSRVTRSLRAADSEKSRVISAGGSGINFRTRSCRQERALDKNARKLTGKEKSLALQRSEKDFKSKNPFVTVAIQPSYVGVGQNKHSTNIPLKFVEAHFNREHNNVILQLPGGKAWPMKYYVPKGTRRPAKVNNGWMAFALDNHLTVGDACVFELINRTENILRVEIFRNMYNQNDSLMHI